MFSAVLMVALTTGAQAPDCHRSCGGCHVSSGCHSSCHARHGCHTRHHGCHSCYSTCYGGGYGGCYGGGYGGCYGGGYVGCYGGGYGGGCYGGGYGGGCYGGGGYFGAPPTMPPAGGSTLPPPDKGTGKNPPPPPPPGETVAPSTIQVNLPAEARLTVDGKVTTSTSNARTLVTPTLQPGFEYYYTLQAQVVRDGQTLTQTQRVVVRSGEQARVSFDFSSGAVASSR